MFTTLSLPTHPVSKPFDFRFISVDISRFQRSPVGRRRKRSSGPASQHSTNPGLTCSTHLSTPAVRPYAREESPRSQVQVPRPQATSSPTIQLSPAVSHVPTPPPPLLDSCGQVEALRDRLKPLAMPQDDANRLPLPMTPLPTGSEWSASPVADQVKNCSATAKQEPADGLTAPVPPSPTLAPCDKRTSNEHALPISCRPMPTCNIEVQRGSADRNFHCRPGLVPVAPDTADDEDEEVAPLNFPVSVKRRGSPIVLIRLSRTIREDYAQALDYRESCDLTDDPPPDARTRRRQRPSPHATMFARHAAEIACTQ
ncbi:hypothetical protein LTR57_025449 [Friedmanniomyces endolithicus]|nr:hypothetical protein LTR59_012790 [Friedmanniomyces endolithicus]KAK0782119.1 hypothetical protein LTR38_013495 [Friedmanniomyces endolithicus]KAK0889008.1 hypothetical protein LTR57_025449 [Friedmanniomyces endolithicus]